MWYFAIIATALAFVKLFRLNLVAKNIHCAFNTVFEKHKLAIITLVDKILRLLLEYIEKSPMMASLKL
jgi:hypothetical protein